MPLKDDFLNKEKRKRAENGVIETQINRKKVKEKKRAIIEQFSSHHTPHSKNFLLFKMSSHWVPHLHEHLALQRPALSAPPDQLPQT